MNSNCPKGICAIVGAHHGWPQETRFGNLMQEKRVYSKLYSDNDRLSPRWEALREEWLSFSLNQSGYASASELPQLTQGAQLLLSGLLIMADWLASNTSYFPLIPIDTTGAALQMPLRVNTAWEKLRLPESWHPMRDAGGFEAVFGFSSNAVQELVLQTVNAGEGGGIFILEAQMGVGKTEAALAAAEILASKSGCGGVFFGLPTQATANGLFDRFK